MITDRRIESSSFLLFMYSMLKPLQTPHAQPHNHLLFVCLLYHPPNNDDFINLSLSLEMDQLITTPTLSSSYVMIYTVTILIGWAMAPLQPVIELQK